MRKRILVADDEWAILELLRIRLSKWGFEVSVAQNAKEFENLAFTVKPDLVILDIWFGNPGAGLQIYEDVIQAGFDPEIPVIFISAMADGDKLPKRAMKGGRFAFYGKPFDFKMMLEDIDRLTENVEVRTSQRNFD